MTNVSVRANSKHFPNWRAESYVFWRGRRSAGQSLVV